MISNQQINLKLSQHYYPPNLKFNPSPNYFEMVSDDISSNWYKRDGSRSPLQRKAANERERKRMHSINKGFDCLRERLPTPPYAKKLSKVETLKNAIDYIYRLNKMLEKNCNDFDDKDDQKSENYLNSSSHQEKKFIETNVVLRDQRDIAFDSYDQSYGTCTLNINWQNTRDNYAHQFLSQNDHKYGTCSSTWIPPSQNEEN